MLCMWHCNPFVILSHRPSWCGAGLWAKCAHLEPQCRDWARHCGPVWVPSPGLHAPARVPLSTGTRLPDRVGHLLQPWGNSTASYPQHFATDCQWEQHFTGPQQCLLWYPTDSEAGYRGRGVWGAVFHNGATPRDWCHPLGVQAILHTLQTLPTTTLPPVAPSTLHPRTPWSVVEWTHPQIYRQVSELVGEYFCMSTQSFMSVIAACFSNLHKTQYVLPGIPDMRKI